MKKTIALMAIVWLPLWLLAQNDIRISVKDVNTKESLIGASVQLKNSSLNGQTNTKGEFRLTNLESGTHTVMVSYLGYRNVTKEFSVPGDASIDVLMDPATFLADEVVVQATRASANAATTYKNLSKEEIAKNNMGQDIPYLLNQTPSVVASSDAGAGVGYTGIRIRGSDAQRINVTVNGIPYNDSESQGSFWVNMPDFASSVDNIQIQRGVGTSTNGAGAFGASINIQTGQRIDTAYAELDNSFGSYNTWKNTVKIGSGLINDQFTFDARLSRIESDGYMDNAFSDLKSFYVSGAWYGKSSFVRANVFSGKEKTYQAWNGVPEELLETDRTYSEFTYEDQTDNYTQTHYQLLYSNQIDERFLINGALHYTRGKGYYEEFKEDDMLENYQLPPVVIGDETIESTDLVRQRWLDNYFYGLTYSVNYRPSKIANITVGGAYNQYRGDHYGEVIWARYSSDLNLGDKYYLNDAEKNDFNVYAKGDFRIGQLNLFGDVQYRKIDYTLEGIDKDLKLLDQDVNYDFINPKVGLTYSFDNNSQVYASMAIANKEPVRDDFTESSVSSRPSPERLTDFEAGYRISARDFNIGLNGYAMLYKDQLVFTGQINDVGAAVRENVDKSYRIGVEMDASWRPIEDFMWRATAAFSQNKIKDYSYYIDIYDSEWGLDGQQSETLGLTDIALSPNAVLSNEFAYVPFDRAEIALLSKYVSRQYLDNTGDQSKSIDPFFVSDLRLSYNTKIKGVKNVGITLKINNIFNELYEASGYTFGYYNPDGNLETYNYYFPQATRNFMLGVNLKF
ncbi:TonB-dependent receptor [Albibacterium indicum]|uniref:TonB-dependent receptor n=1 Tax=Albibacterium indicum TaxID=2292082 RepID=UPI001FE344C3|nr:TonB-dependent receptor [Pedobacter indicus]